jgi:hypothetical protein
LLVSLALATGAATVGVGAAGVVPAAAEGPTIVVTPDHVFDSQTIGVDISGFPDTPPGGVSAVVECSGAVATAPERAPSLCGVRAILNSASGPLPVHAETTVSVEFTTFRDAGRVDCRTDPDGCMVGVVTVTDPFGNIQVVASAFDEIFLVNALSGTPSRQLADSDVVAVTGRNVEAGDWSIAQCGRAFLDDPTAGQAAALCGASQPVTLGADGSFTASLVVHDPLTPSGGGDGVACGGPGCVIVLTSAAVPVGASFGISFGPVTLTADPDHDLVNGSSVALAVSGATPGDLLLYQCATPVGDTVSASRCVGVISIVVGDTGSASGPVQALTKLEDAEPPIDCRLVPCIFAAFDSDHQLVAQTGPLSFRPPPTMTLSPATGLLEGTLMNVTVDNLAPNTTYWLQRCTPTLCDSTQQPATSGADGKLAATVPASQRVHGGFVFAYCRDNCHVQMDALNGSDVLKAPYAMAAGALGAAPDTGLSDGQTVNVTGTDLMPTYAGPMFWIFPTGGWAVTQCDKAILDQATLAGALTHCGAAPVTRAVTVDGSTLEAPLDVRATLTKIIGGTTDCTTAPGACVVGLVRLEQDGSLSTHLTPISFS